MIVHECEDCGATVRGADLEAFGDAFIIHVRAEHPDWPFPDRAIRNYAEALERLTGGKERLEAIGSVEVRVVTEENLDDWASFFDHDAFADNPAWAACYCAEPHLVPRRGEDPDAERRSWQQNRETMLGLLRAGRSYGYLAYVDGRPGGWVNASKRSETMLLALGDGARPPDDVVVALSCFAIAPPYRRHGLATRLLSAALADAASRGVDWVEAYPFNGDREGDAGQFHGPRSLFEEHGFEPAPDADQYSERYTVMRRRA